MNTEVLIVDNGGANIASIAFALARLKRCVRVSSDAQDVMDASHVILPGVGSAGPAMARLQRRGLDIALRARTRPVLGICLGMQLLFEHSAESDSACLGTLQGRVERLPTAPGIYVPHMGWNQLHWLSPHPLFEGIPLGSHAYFVHSYAAGIGPYTTARCEHGMAFSAAVSRQQWHGVQFHPERSGALGARILQNFLAMAA